MRRLYRYLVLTLALTNVAMAQDADAWRGAWIADVDGERHVLYLVFRNDTISGFHCFACANPANLAFVDDGVLDARGLRFQLYHTAAADVADIRQADATLSNGELTLSLAAPGLPTITTAMRRAAPQTQPSPVADATPNQPGAGRARALPGKAEVISAGKVLGLWLWGTGPTKQYFIFKRHKDGIRGMVCGPCDSAKDFAPLENVSFNGSNFHFDIVHEDNGIGFEQYGPFSNVTDAQVVLNEMHMTTYASFDPQGRRYEMTLLGPVQYMPATLP